MSERLPEIPPAQEPQPRDSSVGIVIRKGRNGRWQVLLGLRSARASFMPGHWAFLGGGVEPEDEPGREGYFARCVAREIREEAGLRIPVERWIDVGERITPPIYPVRYRTRFFLAQAPDGASVSTRKPLPEELEALRFVPAYEALDEWRRGSILIPPVLPPLLEVIAEEPARDVNQLSVGLEEANRRENETPRIEYVPGVWILPQRSETLPPATHTNTWLVGGGQFVIVDPGSADEGELDRLLAVIERRRSSGGEARGIVLTHHHADHTAGAQALAERLSLPVLAHPATIERMDGALGGVSTEPLEDGATLELDGMSLRVLHTPGHAAGHVALHAEERDVVVAGDLISGLSSILIDPSDGDMGDYLRSLRRLRDVRAKYLFPGHGPPLPPQAPDLALEHRLDRETRVRAALRKAARPIEEIAHESYEDTPDVPAVLARRQTLAHLIRLEKRGIARRDDDEGRSWALVV